MDVLKQIWANFQVEIAGLLGAFVAARYMKEIDTRRDWIMFVVSGIPIAHYGTPLASQYFGIDETGTVGFATGALGGAIISAILKGLANTDVWQLAKELAKSAFRKGG